MSSEQSTLDPYFEEGFIQKHAGKIMNLPEFALVELVANAWDAGAEIVKLKIPEKVGGLISIEDNGSGMTQSEFEKIWPVLSYNRVKHQGKLVIFPEKRSKIRLAYGRNGKGRHAMFCFADEYEVETWREGESCLFSVKIFHGKRPFEIKLINKKKKNSHGTILNAKLSRNLLEKDYVKELLGSKFIIDPTFKLFVNEEKVLFTDLKHLMDKFTVNTSYGDIDIYLFDTLSSGRTTKQYGVAWWVNGRLVGAPSWGRIEGTYIDGRTSEAKRYTFVIIADILESEVKKDWNGFHASKKYNEILSIVEANVIKKIQDLFLSKRKERKIQIIKQHRQVIKKLPIISRDKIGDFINDVQMYCPTLGIRELNNLTNILINLEKANSGYDLLSKIAEVPPDDIDTLNEILSKWTIQDAKIVLDVLERRLNLIIELQKMVEIRSDELHQLQPLFERGLWIFGPEYESVHFTSNRTLTLTIKKLFNIKTPSKTNIRPDFIVLQDSTIKIYSSDAYDDEGEVEGTDKVLIIELKRGDYKLERKDLHQAQEYAAELRKHGQIQPSTKIVAYVLGYSIAQEAMNHIIEGNSRIIPVDYGTILRKAHKRLFNLHEKIKKYKNIKEDDEIKEVLVQRGLNDYD